MTGHAVPEGALYYASSKRRRVVAMDSGLRQAVANTAAAVRRMLVAEVLPPPLTGEQAQQRCKGCSLNERCQPQAGASTAMSELRAHLFDPEA
jgi:CRISPR-associated exonuclease Cas4